MVGKAFNIGGGSRIALNEAIELLGELSGRELEVTRREHQRGDVRDTAADITAAGQAWATSRGSGSWKGSAPSGTGR